MWQGGDERWKACHVALASALPLLPWVVAVLHLLWQQQRQLQGARWALALWVGQMGLQKPRKEREEEGGMRLALPVRAQRQ